MSEWFSITQLKEIITENAVRGDDGGFKFKDNRESGPTDVIKEKGNY